MRWDITIIMIIVGVSSGAARKSNGTRCNTESSLKGSAGLFGPALPVYFLGGPLTYKYVARVSPYVDTLMVLGLATPVRRVATRGTLFSDNVSRIETALKQPINAVKGAPSSLAPKRPANFVRFWETSCYTRV